MYRIKMFSFLKSRISRKFGKKSCDLQERNVIFAEKKGYYCNLESSLLKNENTTTCRAVKIHSCAFNLNKQLVVVNKFSRENNCCFHIFTLEGYHVTSFEKSPYKVPLTKMTALAFTDNSITGIRRSTRGLSYSDNGVVRSKLYTEIRGKFVDTDSEGHIYTDTYNHEIIVYSPNFEIVNIFRGYKQRYGSVGGIRIQKDLMIVLSNENSIHLFNLKTGDEIHSGNTQLNTKNLTTNTCMDKFNNIIICISNGNRVTLNYYRHGFGNKDIACETPFKSLLSRNLCVQAIAITDNYQLMLISNMSTHNI